jgi:hypothetical protein
MMTLILAGAAAPTALAIKPAHGQADTWREYRRDDLGFRIEMPGEPKVEVKEDEFKDIIIRTVEADVSQGTTNFGVRCDEYAQPVSADELFVRFRHGMQLGGMGITRETSLVMNGFPAREFVRESPDLNFIRREVVVGNLTIAAMVFGERDIHMSDAARRVMASFELLRRPRR